MKEIIILADAYPRIKNALYVLSKYHPEYRITLLILGSSDLFKFFKVINENVFNNDINLKYFELFHPNPRRIKAKLTSKIFYILHDIIRQRRYMKETFDGYLAEFKDCDVFSFNKGYTDFYVVKKLSEKNNITYISSYPTNLTPIQYTPTTIIDLAKLIITKLIFGRGMAISKIAHIKGSPNMSDRFMETKVDKVINGQERDEMLKDFELSRFKVFDVSSHSVIYFDQNLIESPDILDKNTYREELTGIFEILSRVFPVKEIALKYHPGSNNDKTVPGIGDILPDFIPAEFLYNDNVKIYLSAYSSALANVEKGAIVSILNLISFKNDIIRDRFKEILINLGGTKVLFPTSLDEFEKLLIDIKQEANSSV